MRRICRGGGGFVEELPCSGRSRGTLTFEQLSVCTHVDTVLCSRIRLIGALSSSLLENQDFAQLLTRANNVT
jgi:hypothetical protein